MAVHEPSNTYARDFRRVVSHPSIRSRFAAPVSPAVLPGRAVARRLQKCPPLPDIFCERAKGGEERWLGRQRHTGRELNVLQGRDAIFMSCG
jgi:hypothetical protein